MTTIIHATDVGKYLKIDCGGPSNIDATLLEVHLKRPDGSIIKIPAQNLEGGNNTTIRFPILPAHFTINGKITGGDCQYWPYREWGETKKLHTDDPVWVFVDIPF